jgi:hypothetical protein
MSNTHHPNLTDQQVKDALNEIVNKCHCHKRADWMLKLVSIDGSFAPKWWACCTNHLDEAYTNLVDHARNFKNGPGRYTITIRRGN